MPYRASVPHTQKNLQFTEHEKLCFSPIYLIFITFSVKKRYSLDIWRMILSYYLPKTFF